MTHYRSVFISDVHLGTPDCRAEYLLDCLRQLRCETLYLVGDIIDLEALARRSYWPGSHAAVLGELFGLPARGTRVVYIPGNHDAPLRGLVGQTISGIEVKLHAEHTGADGRRYRISHGDEFDPEQVGKRWLLWVGEHGQRLLCWLNRGFNRVRRGLSLPYLPLTIIAKSRIAGALAYIRQYEQRVAALAAEQGYDGHICGRIHYGTIRQLEGVLYLNDGDWVEHCTALTEHPDGRMELLHWSDQRSALATADAQRVHSALPEKLALASLSPQRLGGAGAKAA
jgi:UDP-2,3-diacylglucosamine pyrophosphatase LpxH